MAAGRGKVADAQQVAARVRQSRKYACLCPDTVDRVAAWAAARHRSPKAAAAAARRKLHQVYGAYLAGWRPGAAAAELDALGPQPGAEALRAACLRVMRMHASTRERLPLIESVYADVFAVTGVPSSVLDLGCGLHPFALPWMGLPAGARYEAWEIDARMVELVGRFLQLAGRQGRAVCGDVLCRAPQARADVAFLLKMLPCLEQQERGRAVELLRCLDVGHVVVSFPTHTVGGRAVGMRSHYDGVMGRILAELSWPAERIERPQETFYVLRRGCGERREP